MTCDKLADRLGFRTEWTVERGAQQLFETYSRNGLGLDQLEGPQLKRLARIAQLLAEGQLGEDLRWRTEAAVGRQS